MKKIMIMAVLMLISMSAFASNTYDVTADYEMPAAFKGCSVYRMDAGLFSIPMVAMSCPDKNVSNGTIRVGKQIAGVPVFTDKDQSSISGIFIDKEHGQVVNISCQNMKGTLVCTKE